MNREMEERIEVWSKTIKFLPPNCKEWAIRWLTDDQEGAKVGDCLRPSYEWDIENDISCYETTGEMLPGTCGMGLSEGSIDEIEEVIASAPYYGKPVLIAGEFGGFGNDLKEVYIIDAVVMAV